MTAQAYVRSRFYKFSYENSSYSHTPSSPPTHSRFSANQELFDNFVPAQDWKKKFKVNDDVWWTNRNGMNVPAKVLENDRCNTVRPMYRIKPPDSSAIWVFEEDLEAKKAGPAKELQPRHDEEFTGEDIHEIWFGHNNYFRIVNKQTKKSTIIPTDISKIWDCIDEDDIILISQNKKTEISVRVIDFDYRAITFEYFEEPASYTEAFYNWTEEQFLEYMKEAYNKHKKIIIE